MVLTLSLAPSYDSPLGLLRYNNDAKRLEYCTGSAWTASYEQPPGSSRGSAIASCDEVVNAGLAATGTTQRFWFASDAQGGDIFLAACRFADDGAGGISATYLGGDGTLPEAASVGCDELKIHWAKADGM